MQKYIPLTVTKIIAETDDVKRITLVAQNGEKLPYKAGQFLSFVLPGIRETERRSYSFSTDPYSDKEMGIAVKRVDNGLFSRRLHDNLKTGNVLYSTGVSGLFTLPDNMEGYNTLCFFAAGIGITPVFSLIKSALHLYKHVSITLFYSNRSIDDTVFYTELNLLAAEHTDRLQIVYLFSTSPELARARLNKELVPELMQQYASDLTNPLCYVCGPYAYMRMVIYALEEMNIPAANIRKENFDTTITPFKPQPHDKEPHLVHLNLKGQAHTFTSTYPDTILQAAEKDGLSLPYSCRNGVCGACAAYCKAGKVWHSGNEVLTDEKLDKGIILTCCSYPIDGDISIEVM